MTFVAVSEVGVPPAPLNKTGAPVEPVLVATIPSVVATDTPVVATSRHGKYADSDDRRRKMREYMRQRRSRGNVAS